MKKEIEEYLAEQGIKSDETRFKLIYKMVEGFAERLEDSRRSAKRIWNLTALCVIITVSFNVATYFKADPEIHQTIEREYKGDRWILETYCSEIGFHKSDTGVADKIDVMKDWRLQQCEDLLDTLNMLND